MRLVTHRHVWGIVLLVLGLAPVRPAHAQSPDLGSYVLFATDELRSRGLQVQEGDVGVNQGSLYVRTGLMLDAPNSELSADTAIIPTEAICRRLVARSPGPLAPRCPAVTTFAPPFADAQAVGVACGFPDPFPACSTDPARNVVVAPDETRALDPGTYGQVVVRAGGSLTFGSGTYTLCGLRTARSAEVIFQGPTTLRVAGDVRFGTQSVVNPRGVDGRTVELFASGSVVRLARGAQATLRICAPFSTLRVGHGVKAYGRFVARHIFAGSLETGFPTTTTTSTSSTTTSSTSTSSTTSTSSSSTTTSSTSSTSSSSTSSTTSSSTTTSSTTSSSSSTSSTSSTTTSTSSTTSTSVAPRCGDGIVNQPSEACDDGNLVDDDCCSLACVSAADGTPCGTGDVCSGDQICESGVCTATTAAETLACRVPLTSAIVTNFDDATASVFDVTTGMLSDPVPVGRGAWGVAIRPGGDEIWVTAREDDLITILDAESRDVRERLTVGSLPLGIVFDPAGTRAYVASFATDEVLILDAESRAELGSIAVGDGPSGLTLDPSGRRLYVSNFGGNSISVIDLASERVVTTIKTKKRPLELALDAVRGRLYVTNFAADRVSIIGTISDSVLTSVRVGKKPFGSAVDPATGLAYVTNGASDSVSVVDGEQCKTVATIPVGDGPLGIGLDLTGTRAVVANGNDATLSIIDTTTNTVIATPAVGTTPVAFGGFIGPLLDGCPRAPLACDDVNPMTLDSCAGEVGCRFEALPPSDAAKTGLTALDTTVREAGVTALGGTKRAVLLSRLAVAAHTALVEGAGTPQKSVKRADRSVKRFTKVVRAGIRRRKMSCGVGQDILDLSRGVRVQLRLAR